MAMTQVTDQRTIDELNRRYAAQNSNPPPMELELNAPVKTKKTNLKPVTDPDLIAKLDAEYDAQQKNQGIPNKDSEVALPEQEGDTSIWEDVKNSVATAPEAFMQTLQKIRKEGPGVVKEGAKQSYTNPLRFGGNVGSGALDVFKHLISSPGAIAEYLGKKGVPGYKQLLPISQRAQIGDTGLRQKLFGENQKGDVLPEIIGESLSLGGMGGVERGIANSFLRSGVFGGNAAAEKQDPLHAALGSLLTEGAGNAAYQGGRLAGRGARLAADMADPANIFRGYLTPEELQANLRAAEGTNTPLGRVIESPALTRRYENSIATTPGSGALATQADTKAAVEQSGRNVIENIRPDNMDGDPNLRVQQLLNHAADVQETRKNNLYRERNRVANAEGHQLNLSNFYRMINEHAHELRNSPLYQTNPKFRRTVNNLTGYQQIQQEGESIILGQNGRPISTPAQLPSITEATSMMNTLEREGEQLTGGHNSSQTDRHIGGIYERLGSTLRNDINDSVENTGSRELQQAHRTANRNYLENFLPTLNIDIRKMIRESKDPQSLIHEIIQPGKETDKHSLIERVNDLLPPDQRNILGHYYLQKSIDPETHKISPKILAQRINSLGPRQKRALFPDPEYRQMLTDFGNLRGMNEKALNAMFNPETGAKMVPHMKAAAMIAAVASGNVPALAGVGTTIGAARLGNWLMTNESFRHWLVNRMAGRPARRPRIVLPNDPEILRAAREMQNQDAMANIRTNPEPEG